MTNTLNSFVNDSIWSLIEISSEEKEKGREKRSDKLVYDRED